jgi:hypothetical protein
MEESVRVDPTRSPEAASSMMASKDKKRHGCAPIGCKTREIYGMFDEFQERKVGLSSVLF